MEVAAGRGTPGRAGRRAAVRARLRPAARRLQGPHRGCRLRTALGLRRLRHQWSTQREGEG